MIPGLQRYRLIQSVALSGLDEGLKRGFRYAKIKGETLFFVFGHEGMKLEFKYKQEEILEKLRGFYKINKRELLEMRVGFRKIACVVVRKQNRQTQQRQEELFGERSSGEFKINATNERVCAVFTDIKNIIKKRIERWN